MKDLLLFLAYFWINNLGLWAHLAACASPSFNLLMPEPIFMKIGTYITAPESISTAN
jgi:hypothetical protein